MTCQSCESKVTKALMSIKGINNVQVSKENQSAKITMESEIKLSNLQSSLEDKYQISDQQKQITPSKKSWFTIYKPVVLIFIYIFSTTFLFEITQTEFDVFRLMRHFMAGFFLTFSFFKMLNLKGFKDSYLMYDIIARKYPNWGYIYAFMELILGVLFLINFSPIFTNALTLIVMSLSIIGVLQTVLNKKTIKCACLGDVFNLPMSTVTIIEDGLMILMSLSMLIVNLV